MKRDEIAVRVAWPLVWGAGVCAVYYALVSVATLAQRTLPAWLLLVGIVACFLGFEWLTPRLRAAVRPKLRGVDLLAPELAGERFLGVVVVITILAVATYLAA